MVAKRYKLKQVNYSAKLLPSLMITYWRFTSRRKNYGKCSDSQLHVLGISHRKIFGNILQCMRLEIQRLFNFQIYKRRWYILLVYGLMAGTQCGVWNTFGPISEVSERVFGWNDGDISLLANWGPISYVVGTFAFSWIMDEKG